MRLNEIRTRGYFVTRTDSSCFAAGLVTKNREGKGNGVDIHFMHHPWSLVEFEKASRIDSDIVIQAYVIY